MQNEDKDITDQGNSICKASQAKKTMGVEVSGEKQEGWGG